MLRTFEQIEPLQMRSDGDTNIVEGWIVPYRQIASVVDVMPDGEQRRYREAFEVGSCTRMAQGVARRGNAGFVRLTLDHGHSLADRVGCGVTLVERGSEGAWASFKLYESADLTKVRAMIEDSHDGFSIEFDDVVPPFVRDDVTWRRQVQIPAVSLTPSPAYVSARVASLRDAELIDDETPLLSETQLWLASQRSGTVDDETETQT